MKLKRLTISCVCVCAYTVHGFTKVSYDVDEGDSLELLIFEPNVKGETRFPMPLILGNIIAEPSGTARKFICYVGEIKMA